MRKILTLILISLISFPLLAQTPEKINYQAIVRDSNNELVTNSAVGIEISILKNSTTGTVVYTEQHIANSNSNGLISIEIGSDDAIVIQGNISSIDWHNGTHYVNTRIDPTGGSNYAISGTVQLLSVPYSLHSKTAEELTTPIIEIDGSITNEIQDLQLVGNILTITNNNAATEIDLSAYENEIQDLILVGDVLKITNNDLATEIDLSKYNITAGDTINLIAGDGINISGTYPDITISATTSTSTHYVGELIGPNGEDGIVFWVDHTGQHGLICSPEDLNGANVVWSNEDVLSVPDGALSTFEGYPNTIAINNQSSNSAAGSCLTYSTPGTNTGDWYLPSVDEFSKIYQAKYEINKALNENTFDGIKYWTSTELNFNSAWYFNMQLGFSNNEQKLKTSMVRAIRTF